jgi:hypothetical protein
MIRGGAMPEFDEPFFKRVSTRSVIGELAGLGDWTIYLGSGATIDRTGMSWRGLVKKLLNEFEPDESLQNAILDAHGEIRTATIVEGLYRREYDNDISQMNDDVRKLMYKSRKFLKGRLLESVAGLVYFLAKRGDSVVVVTTNYDAYAKTEIGSHIALARKRAADAGLTEPRVELSTYVATASDPELPDPAGDHKITCAYVHGFIGEVLRKRDESRELDEQIVLSEGQYYETYDRTREVLSSAFRNRNVLILGSAVSDPPLVDALRETRPAEGTAVRRYAVLPMQSGEFYERGLPHNDTRLPAWNAQRLEAIGVSPIYCDFYSQAGQLVHEVHKCMERGDAHTMLREYSPGSYRSRVNTWWREWEALNCGDGVNQNNHHALLLEHLGDIKRLLRSSPQEVLKLDMWIRWHPESERRMVLWASSSGTWVDQSAMRAATIPENTGHVAVGAFCNGAPTFTEESTDQDARWRSYLGVPIWIDMPTGDIPVGVITLASMWDAKSGSVSEHNLVSLKPVLDEMRAAGAEIVSSTQPGD